MKTALLTTAILFLISVIGMQFIPQKRQPLRHSETHLVPATAEAVEEAEEIGTAVGEMSPAPVVLQPSVEAVPPVASNTVALLSFKIKPRMAASGLKEQGQ